MVFFPKDPTAEILALCSSVLFWSWWQHNSQNFLPWRHRHLSYLAKQMEKHCWSLGGVREWKSDVTVTPYQRSVPHLEWHVSVVFVAGAALLSPPAQAQQFQVPPWPLAPPPWWKRHFLTLPQRAPSLASSSVYSLRRPPSRHPSWESMDLPENPVYLFPAWLSLPCSFCLDNIHPSKSFKIWSHHQTSSISAQATHADTQTGWQCDDSSNECLVVFFNTWKCPPGLAFQFWHLQAVWPESGYLSFLKLNFLLYKMGLLPTSALLQVIYCNDKCKGLDIWVPV